MRADLLQKLRDVAGKDEEACKEWCELNDKYLFRSSQPWTRDQAHAFINDAWDYVGVDVS